VSRKRQRTHGCLAESIAIHGLVALGLLAVPARLQIKPDAPRPTEVVFFRAPAPIEPEPVIVPPEPEPPPAPKPEPKPVVVAKVEPPPPAAPPPPPRVIPPKVEPLPEIARKEPPKMPPAAEPPPAKPAAPARVVVRVEGFAVAKATDRASKKPEVRVPVSGGFNEGAMIVSQQHAKKPERASVTPGAFGSAVTAAAPAVHEERGDVKRGGFGEVAAPAVARARPERPAGNPDTAVEIVSKATPVYTDEARQLRIEGAVVLEVTFDAAGSLQILRVIESLGHGLDEAAVAAAKQTRFKPARRDGRAVDHTTTLRVVFRLA
jgi:protein TonB